MLTCSALTNADLLPVVEMLKAEHVMYRFKQVRGYSLYLCWWVDFRDRAIARLYYSPDAAGASALLSRFKSDPAAKSELC